MANITVSARKKALAKHLGEDVLPSEVEVIDEDQGQFKWGREEYLVLTDSEANAAASASIKDSAWAFNASFLCGFLGLPCVAEEMIKGFQEAKCEGANDTILAMIGEDFDRFADEAISADGRGHFLSGYDGQEHEYRIAKDYIYIYRTN